jgi:hypothetical protein
MATRKRATKRAATKRVATSERESKPQDAAKALQVSPGDIKAAAEAQTPLEPIGPGVEHEDHEGGATDSLARKGVRGSITPEEIEEADEELKKSGAIRGASVRERQILNAGVLRQGGMAGIDRGETDEEGKVVRAPLRGAMATQAAKKGSKTVMVKATAIGHYPADGRLRVPGEVFPYVLTEAEKGKLPSWVEPVGSASKLEKRERGEPSGAITAPLIVEIAGAPAGATITTRRADRNVV